MEEKTLFDDMAESGSKLPDMVKQLTANGWKTRNHHDNWVHSDWEGEYSTHEAFKRIGVKEDVSLTTKVFESLGEISMCWSETPRGIFESTKTKENLTKELNSQVLNRKEVGISGTSEDIQKCKEIFDEGVICKTKIRWSVDDSAPTGILSLIDIERFVPYRATYEFTLTKELEDIFLEYLDGMSLQKSRSILNNVMSRIDNYSVINLK